MSLYEKHHLEWLDKARCAKDPDSVRDAHGDSNDPDELDDADAQAFADYHCGACPVMLQCLRHAVNQKEVIGVWGGHLPQERVGLVDGEGVLGG